MRVEGRPAWQSALGLYAACALAAAGAILLSRQPGSLATLWAANAIAISWLLARPAAEAPGLLVAFAAAILSGNVLVGDPPLAAAAFVPGNLFEVLLASQLLRRWGRLPDALEQPGLLARALLLGVLVPAAAGALMGAVTLALLQRGPFVPTLLLWLQGSLLGSVAVLPLGLLLGQHGLRPLRGVLGRPEVLAALLLTLAVALWTPGTLPFPFVYVLVPLVLVAALGGFEGAAVGVLVVAATLGTLTSLGMFLPPPTAMRHGELLFHLPLLLTLLPPLLLGAAQARVRVLLQRLQEAAASYRSLYQNSPVMLHSIDTEGRLVAVSERWLKTLGYTREQVEGRLVTDFLTPPSQRYAREVAMPQFFRDSAINNVEYQMRKANGDVIDVRLSARWERASSDHALRTVAVLQDVTEEKRLAAELASEHELLQVTLQSIGDGVVCTDAQGLISFLNPVAEELTGWRTADALGRPFAEVVRLHDASLGLAHINPVERCLASRTASGLPENAVLTGRNGREVSVQDTVSPILGRDGALRGAVMVFQDVTEARGLAQRMSYLAHHDALTGLPNRVLLQDRITQACQFGQRHGLRFAVVFLDLDHFKQVNDTLGHAVGDELLKTVARRLQGTLRASDTVCRLGGDEFVMLADEIGTPEDASAVARKLLAELAPPVQLAGRELHIGASLGLALFPEDGDDPATLMKHADSAMYRAKREGRNGFQFYSASYEQELAARMQLESELRRALLQGGLTLHFQPQVDARTLLPRVVECLLRWERPGLPPIGPAQFVPVAEECGLITALGLHVLRSACAQVQAWRGTPMAGLRVAVNVSPLQLAAPGFAATVAGILAEHGVAPEALELEITETALVRTPDDTLEVLRQLKALGLHIAIDDFGTGYSSLSHLKHFPVDVVKIDRSFIRDMEHNADDRALVSAIVAMGKSLRLELVAEGVETEGQAALLREFGCSLLQGYVFAKPAPAEQTADWVKAQLDLRQAMLGA